MIELDAVSISVRGVRILEGCTARLEAGTVTHLAGANGSGKTSLIRALAGIQRFSGDIRFDRRTIDALDVRRSLYVCWDDAAVFPYLNGYENIRMLVGRPLARTAMAGLAPSIAGDDLLRMSARRLSHGQRKRIHLLAALLSHARYLIFDEALGGVDAPTSDEVARLIAEHAADSTVLVTGHRDDPSIELASHHLELNRGRLVEKDPVA